MDVNFINPFITGAVEVLGKMAFVSPVAGKAYVKTTDDAHGDVSGIIGITGDALGSLAISFSNNCICIIAGNMLGETFTEPTRDVLDAVGEITNMISGVARTKMEKEGMSVYAAIPSVVYGSNHTINHILKTPSIVIPFSTSGGSFVIDVCIRKILITEKPAVAYGVQNIKTLSPEHDQHHRSLHKAELYCPVSASKPSALSGSGKITAREATASSTPQRSEDKIRLMKNRLAELIEARNAMRQHLTDKPFLEPAKRRLYKKNIPVFDARIKKIKLDISAMEMLAQITPEELDNPKVISHYQHYKNRK